jgi:DNA-directed RNA polymerase subunit H
MTTLHLLMRLKYKDLLKMAKDEGISAKGRKRQVAKILSRDLPPEKVREYFAKISGVTASLLTHRIVPEHEIMTKEDVEKLLNTYRCDKTALPKIKDTDPAVLAVKAKPGDVVRIKRKSPTAGESFYYRIVVKHVTSD